MCQVLVGVFSGVFFLSHFISLISFIETSNHLSYPWIVRPFVLTEYLAPYFIHFILLLLLLLPKYTLFSPRHVLIPSIVTQIALNLIHSMNGLLWFTSLLLYLFSYYYCFILFALVSTIPFTLNVPCCPPPSHPLWGGVPVGYVS